MFRLSICCILYMDTFYSVLARITLCIELSFFPVQHICIILFLAKDNFESHRLEVNMLQS